MRLFLRTAPLRAKYGASSFNESVEVPDREAVYLLECDIAVADRRGGAVVEMAVAGPEGSVAAETVDSESGPEPAAEKAAVERAEAGGPVPPWTLSTSPEDYLKRWPDGKHAELAALHVQAEQ